MSRSLFFAGLAITVAGGSMAIFGAVYSTSIFTGTEYGCGHGCQGGSFQSIVSSYYLYPLWSQPTWSHPDYNVSGCTIHSWYTPLTPPSACTPPPASISANYTLNITGVILILAGIVMIVRGREVSQATLPGTELKRPKNESASFMRWSASLLQSGWSLACGVRTPIQLSK